VTISDCEFRISDFRPTTQNNTFSREGGGETTGGAWHPDSLRIGVPGILSGRAS